MAPALRSAVGSPFARQTAEHIVVIVVVADAAALNDIAALNAAASAFEVVSSYSDSVEDIATFAIDSMKGNLQTVVLVDWSL